jgi:hypothetical protein
VDEPISDSGAVSGAAHLLRIARMLDDLTASIATPSADAEGAALRDWSRDVSSRDVYSDNESALPCLQPFLLSAPR